MDRKPLPKTLRFDVFKRDCFTCQYCGKKAPEVILEVDHIEPVSKGGTDSITNLITSCRDCNRGKKDKRLSQNCEVEKKQAQLELLQERKEQLEMIKDWEISLLDVEEQQVDFVEKIVLEGTGRSFSNSFRERMKVIIRTFGFQEVIESAKISKKYFIYKNGKIELSSINYALEKTGGICYVRKNGGNYEH